MNKRVVLITGTSTGIGMHTAVLLAQKGDIVYASMRNVEKSDRLQQLAKECGVKVNLLPLDVTSMESVEAAVAAVISEQGRIDVLINNAGAGFVRTTEHASLEDIAWVNDVNYMGVVRCTKAVLPHMRERRLGHIINISSVGGLVGQPFNEFYCAAKFAVEGYTESLASYVTPSFNVKFTLVEPGGVSTEFVNNVMGVSNLATLPDDEYKPVLQKYLDSARNRSSNEQAYIYQRPDQVAAVIVSCLENQNPPLRVRTSPWAEEFCNLKTDADPDGLKLNSLVVSRFLNS
jgi:NAD(P)-dependent dehydrogenase (short-subunit alcohol dehydrogenase family)